jgi:peptide/nickel transport system ATP-binding protein
MPDPILSVRELRVTFVGSGRPVPAVRGIDFDVFPNEVLGIVGESGSGKSVASLAVAGLLPAIARIEGSILLAGQQIIGAGKAALRTVRGRDVGIIFQDPATTLNPLLRIGTQVTEGEVAHGRLSAGSAGNQAIKLLREVDIADPAARVGQYPHQFSGGMRQRAVIAMAMAGRPKLIIADEPTTALDVTVQAQILALLARRQSETGAAVVLITHDHGVVSEVAHRVAVMYAGRIVETGSVRSIFENPRHPYTIALLRSAPRIEITEGRLDPIPGQPPSPTSLPSGCAFHPRCSIGMHRSRCQTEEPALSEVGAGQASACHYSDELAGRQPPVRISAVPMPSHVSPQPAAAPLLAVDDLKVHFAIKSGLLHRARGAVRAVDGVSFELNAGETLGLVGESGCGKTTTGRAVMGLLRSTGGRILFDGKPIHGLTREAMRPIRRQMQYIFQDPYSSLNPIRTAGDIVAEPLRIHGLYDTMGRARWIAQLFDMVGLPNSMAARLPREFSGGQKQRIGIARALALKPRLLILDEPVSSLDVSIQAQIINLLRDLQSQLGLAYLFIAHDLSIVKHISDRVAVMYLGRIVEVSDKKTLFDNPVHPYTQALLSAIPTTEHVERSSCRRIVLQGELPSPAKPPSGCHFHPRCFRADVICQTVVPGFERHPGLPTWRACHHARRLEDAPATSAALTIGAVP